MWINAQKANLPLTLKEQCNCELHDYINTKELELTAKYHI